MLREARYLAHYRVRSWFICGGFRKRSLRAHHQKLVPQRTYCEITIDELLETDIFVDGTNGMFNMNGYETLTCTM